MRLIIRPESTVAALGLMALQAILQPALGAKAPAREAAAVPVVTAAVVERDRRANVAAAHALAAANVGRLWLDLDALRALYGLARDGA